MAEKLKVLKALEDDVTVSTDLTPRNDLQILQESEAAQKIMFDAPDNPTLQILAEIEDEGLKRLKKSVACRSCPISIWMRKCHSLICYCPRVVSIVWDSSSPSESEIIICSARQKRSD